MTRLTTPKEMRQRRDAITAIRMGPKHDWVYRAAPPLGDTDTGVKLFDTNKSFAILTSFHCPGMAEPSYYAPTLADGHVCGFASMSGSKLGIRMQFVGGQMYPNVAWMGYGKSSTYFGPYSYKTYCQAGGRTLTIHRSKALDEYGNPTNLTGSASFELCGIGAWIGNQQATYSTSSVATDTLHVYSCEEIVLDMVAIYLRELTREEEEKWRCYGALP